MGLRLWLFSCPFLSLIPKAVLKGVNLMLFLPQSVARLPPIGISCLELCYLVRNFFCKIQIFQTAKRDDCFSTAYGHIISYILPFVHNACNSTGKDGMAWDNIIRYGLYRKVVKYHLRLGVWRAASYIVRFIICLIV